MICTDLDTELNSVSDIRVPVFHGGGWNVPSETLFDSMSQ